MITRPLILLLAIASAVMVRGQERSTPDSVRAELEAMLETDQLHRSKLTELENTHGKYSMQLKEAWSKQSDIDAHNIRRLEEIIADCGWPGIKQFGVKASAAAFLILQHSALTYQKKYLPFVREAAAKGEMRASGLALLEDRVRLREGQKQIYGSQVTRTAEGEWEPEPIEDEENVDALRAKVGLEPIAFYLQGFADRSGGRVRAKWAKKDGEMPKATANSASPASSPGQQK
jgi:hypothetical protein